jgi:ABC-type sugar transport system ATPase subunit
LNNRLLLGSKVSWVADSEHDKVKDLLSGTTLGVRPEAIGLTTPGEGLTGTIEFTEQLGDATIVYVRMPWHEELIIAKLSQQQAGFRMGERVGLQFDPKQLMWFDAQGKRLSAPAESRN